MRACPHRRMAHLVGRIEALRIQIMQYARQTDDLAFLHGRAIDFHIRHEVAAEKIVART
jgi:hypothetical protein